MVLKEGMQVGGAGARAGGEVRGPERGIEDPFAWTCHGREGKGRGRAWLPASQGTDHARRLFTDQETLDKGPAQKALCRSLSGRPTSQAAGR